MVSFPELAVLFVIGLLVLGPERLPRVASQALRWLGKLRRTANELRYQLERQMTAAEALTSAEKDPTREPMQSNAAESHNATATEPLGHALQSDADPLVPDAAEPRG